MQGTGVPLVARRMAAPFGCLLLAACYGAFEFDGGETTVVVISRPPQSVTVGAGQSARFDVAASGRGGAFSYQWLRNGEAIAGAVVAAYVTPATTPADDGTLFTVTVCDASSCATSLPALLTVLRSP